MSSTRMNQRGPADSSPAASALTLFLGVATLRAVLLTQFAERRAPLRRPPMARDGITRRLRSWEGLLLACLIVVALDPAGFTPLHAAAYQGSLPVVTLLVNGKSSVNAADNEGRRSSAGLCRSWAAPTISGPSSWARPIA